MKYKLGDICEIVSGSTPKTNVPEYWDGDIKWITPAEINEETYVVSDTIRKITELGVKETGLSSFPEGTVILSSRAPIGKVAIAGCEMYCNQGFKNLICSETIDNRYLYWFLKHHKEFLQSLGRGATFKEISKQIVSSIEIDVPDMGIQKEAVRTIEKTSEIISLTKKELMSFDELIKARFVELFENAPTKTVEEVCDSFKIGPFGSALHKNEISKEGYAFVLGTDNAVKNKFAYDEIRYIDEAKYHELEKYKVNPEEIIMSMMGTVGRVSIIPEDIGNAIISSHLCILRVNKKFMIPEFFHCAFCEDDNIQFQIDGIHNGSIMKGFNLKIVKAFEIKCPEIDKQKEFLQFKKQLDKSKYVCQKKIKLYQELLDTKMNEYFN